MQEYNCYTKNEDEVQTEIMKLIKNNIILKETATRILERCIDELSCTYVVYENTWVHYDPPMPINAKELAEMSLTVNALQRETNKEIRS